LAIPIDGTSDPPELARGSTEDTCPTSPTTQEINKQMVYLPNAPTHPGQATPAPCPARIVPPRQLATVPGMMRDVSKEWEAFGGRV